MSRPSITMPLSSPIFCCWATNASLTNGMAADFEAILKNVEERDYIDTHRETSPLRKADDAITLDNSEMTIPEQKEWLMKQYQKATEK
jgi:CMP/dCMP kinase